MRKTVTLPTTARDWKETAFSASGTTVQMTWDRKAKADVGSATASLLLFTPGPQSVARCGNHAVQRACSSTCAVTATEAPDALVCTRRPPQEPSAAVFDYDRVHFGWLFLKAGASTRGFQWRFCILDGAHLSYFRDNEPDADCLGHHVLVNVERLHSVNRGLVLTDDKQRFLYAHANHETASFEEWLAVLRAGIQYERRRQDGSIFERSTIVSVSTTSSSFPNESLDVSFTGWLLLRRRRLGCFSAATRYYVVLSGRYLSAFTVNLEGLRAKVSGRVVTAAPHKCSHWLAVTLESGQRLRLAATSPDVTRAWLARIQRALCA